MMLRERIENTRFGFDAEYPHAQVGLKITKAEHDRLLLALDTLEAVELADEQGYHLIRFGGVQMYPGTFKYQASMPSVEGYGTTLPEAVSKLRAAMKEG
jgi:hypothetical protein